MGSSWVAFITGKSPKKTPIAAEKPIANSTTSQPTLTVYSVARFAIAAKPNVKPAPMSPPTTQSKTDSTRNCSRTSDPRAPTASRIPISRVLSVTKLNDPPCVGRYFGLVGNVREAPDNLELCAEVVSAGVRS